MPRHDPAIAANDETAFDNLETILLESDGNGCPQVFSVGTAKVDCAMLMASALERIVERHSVHRRIRGTGE